MDVEERAIDVDGDVTGRRCSPDVLPCRRHRCSDAAQLRGCRRLHRPPGSRDRGDVTEELGLLPEGLEVAQAFGPIGDGDAEMGEHDARVVGVPGDAAAVQCPRHRPCQTGAIGQLGEKCRASVRDEILAIGGHGGTMDRATTMHLQGGLLLVA